MILTKPATPSPAAMESRTPISQERTAWDVAASAPLPSGRSGRESVNIEVNPGIRLGFDPLNTEFAGDQSLSRIQPNTERSTLQISRFAHTATKLADGKVLLVGGATGEGKLDWLAPVDDLGKIFDTTSTAEVYDPTTATTKRVGDLKQARRDHAAVLLPTGQVLIVGGKKWDTTSKNWVYPNVIERYDPDTETFSVMDKLDYGLSEPKAVLMKDGSVFLAGQIQAPMEAPAQPKAMRWDAESKSFRLVSPNSSEANGNALTVGSSLMGFIVGNDIKIDYVTMNQGVQKYLNAFKRADNSGAFPSDENTFTGVPETDPKLKDWKKNVPSIANRPAKLDFIFSSSLAQGSYQTNRLVARLEVIPPAGSPYSAPAPQDVSVTPWPQVSPIQTQFVATFKLGGNETIAGAKVRVTLDPDRMVYPKTLPLEKEAFDIDPGWQIGSTLRFRIIPIHYVDPNKLDLPAPGIDQQSIKDMLERLYPVSLIDCDVLPVLDYIVGSDSKDVSRGRRDPIDAPARENDIYPGWNTILYELDVLRIGYTGKREIVVMGLLPSGIPDKRLLGLTWSGYPQTVNGKNVISNLDGCVVDVDLQNPFNSSLPHELGHSFQRKHAPTPAINGYNSPEGPDGVFPYTNGKLGQTFPISIFDVVQKSDVEFVDGQALTYDLMGYVHPRWISDYTYGGISAMLKSYSAFVGLTTVSMVSGNMTHIVGGATQKVNSDVPVVVIDIKLAGDKVDHIGMQSDALRGAMPLQNVGDYVFRAIGLGGEIFEAKFEVHKYCDWNPNAFMGNVILPTPEKWVKYIIIKNGKTVYAEGFEVDQSVLRSSKKQVSKIQIQMVKNTNDSRHYFAWNGLKPRDAWARIQSSKSEEWIVIPSFSRDKPEIILTKDIISRLPERPVVEIHAWYGFIEKIETYVLDSSGALLDK